MPIAGRACAKIVRPYMALAGMACAPACMACAPAGMACAIASDTNNDAQMHKNKFAKM